MNKFFLMLTICLFASNVFACGGEDLTDAEIAALPFVTSAQEKVATLAGKPVVIESIVRSGNDIINLDKKVVASAMCNANYINVYFATEEASQLKCKTAFQITNGQADFNGLIKGLLCRKANSEQPELIEL